MNILFTDVDGVLNFDNCKAVAPSGCLGVSDSKVRILRRIVEETGAKVVLSSDWRLCRETDQDFRYLKHKLMYKGRISICGVTPDVGGWYRKQEIVEWIESHPEVDYWAVLDDTIFDGFLDEDFAPHLVLTDPALGLTNEDADKAIKILRGE